MAKEDDDIANLEKQVDEMTTKLDDAIKAKSTSEEEIGKLKKQLEDVTALKEQLEKANAENEILKAKAKASDDETAAEDALADDEDEKDGKKKPWPWEKRQTKAGFWLLPADKRAEHVVEFVKARELKKKGDEIVEINGEKISKLAVGAAVFNVLKSQAADIKKQADDLKIEKERRETAELTKVAEDQLGSFVGTVEDKVDLLRALTSIPEKARETLDKMLKAGGGALKVAFDTVGHKNEKAAKSAQDFETKVAEIRKRDSCTRQDAMTKARKEHPEAFKAYQESGAQ